MKGQKILEIFEAILDGAKDTAEVFEAIVTSPKGTTYSGVMYRRELIRRERDRQNRRHELEEFHKRERRRLICHLSKLKREGIVKVTTSGYKRKLSLTGKGKKMYEKIKEKLNGLNYPPVANYKNYKTSKSMTLKIVIFDVPEKHRYKREWLRRALSHIGFEGLQQSVWAGKVALPEEFIDAITQFQLAPCVEIFEVTKSGTMQKLLG